MSGPVAIVTGGSRGIGEATVDRLVRRGYQVLSVSRNGQSEPGDHRGSIVSPGRVVPFRCDVTDADAPRVIVDAAHELGEVMVLVNNAGVTGTIGPLRTVSDETIRTVIDVDLVATIRLSREVVARWHEGQWHEGQGHEGQWHEGQRHEGQRHESRSIVNVSSIAALTGAPGEYVWYAAAKAGVNAFTIGLAREVAASGIRVNAVNPGTTSTTIHERAGRPRRAIEVGARSPLGRAAAADEIAAAIEWLVSAEASYVTGTVLDVSGGVR